MQQLAAPAFYGLAAFGAYSAMYAFRKPFTAATFDVVPDWPYDVDYKTVLLIAQVLGYALSKLIGIRVIAEFGRIGRGSAVGFPSRFASSRSRAVLIPPAATLSRPVAADRGPVPGNARPKRALKLLQREPELR